MKRFFENYGTGIIAALVVAIFVVMATPVSGLINNGINYLVDSFTEAGDHDSNIFNKPLQTDIIYWAQNGGELTLASYPLTGDRSGSVPSDWWENNTSGSAFYTTSQQMKTITSIKVLDGIKPTSCSRMFYGCSWAKTIDVSRMDTSQVKNMYGMFMGCQQATEIKQNFNTKNVEDMRYTFNNCYDVVELNLSNFKTSNVTNMEGLFKGCEALEKVNVSSFDTSNVISMKYMFSYCKKLEKLNLSNFRTGNVRTMYCMFDECRALTKLDLSSFDTSDVKSMESMFRNCRALTNLDISSFNTSKVTSMMDMFKGCSSLTSLDLRHFNTSIVEDMDGMFALMAREHDVTLDLSSFNTSALISADDMFYANPCMTVIDISSFSTDSLRWTESMFYGDTALQKVYVGEGWSNQGIQGSRMMFYNCTSIEGDYGTHYDPDHITAEYATLDTPLVNGYFSSK